MVVESKRGQFQGVRQEVLASRDMIVRNIQTELRHEVEVWYVQVAIGGLPSYAYYAFLVPNITAALSKSMNSTTRQGIR